MKRGTKRLKAKTTGRSELAQDYTRRNPKCELCRLLGGTAWLEFKANDRRLCGDEVHNHHIWTPSRWEEGDANFITACPTAHEFVEKYSRFGRLICCWVKIEKGEFEREVVRRRWRRDPISAIHADVDAGLMEGWTEWEAFWLLVSQTQGV